jgi:hypothetical protein
LDHHCRHIFLNHLLHTTFPILFCRTLLMYQVALTL